MATYKAEALYQRYRHRARPAAHYSLGWLPWWAQLASAMPHLVNRLANGRLAPLGKRLAGVDPRRAAPPFATQTFRHWFDQHPTATGDPVMLWVDTFTNHFTPEVGVAAVQVLEDAGYSVRIPPRRLCCGLTWISTGQLDTARKKLQRSVIALAEVAGSGVAVVGLEPSCAAVLRGDAAELLGTSQTTLAASRSVVTLAELLSQTRGWKPPSFSGTTAVVQPHCHHRAVLGFGADLELLDRAGVATRVVDGCCGLAGNFGAERGHYDISVAVAENALLPAVRQGAGAIVLADGFSCRTQVRELAGRQGIHLAELLAGDRGSTGSNGAGR
jgi:Fe-S oxidoreductase